MMTFISCAKTMTARSRLAFPFVSAPRFEAEARENAMAMAQCSAEEQEKLLRIGPKLAAENRLRYHDFLSPDEPRLPALAAYTGIVFKRIHPQDFTEADFVYAQNHLLITSFLYGLLWPLDGIRCYRMEGDVRLPERGDMTLFDFWKPLLTDFFIEEIGSRGNVLVNLASGEMKGLFDWKKVCGEVQVVTPEFYVRKGSRLTTVVVYAKMCRGEMTRYILKRRIEHPDDLKAFEWEGFAYDEAASRDGRMVFVNHG